MCRGKSHSSSGGGGGGGGAVRGPRRRPAAYPDAPHTSRQPRAGPVRPGPARPGPARPGPACPGPARPGSESGWRVTRSPARGGRGGPPRGLRLGDGVGGGADGSYSGATWRNKRNGRDMARRAQQAEARLEVVVIGEVVARADHRQRRRRDVRQLHKAGACVCVRARVRAFECVRGRACARARARACARTAPWRGACACACVRVRVRMRVRVRARANARACP